MRVSCQFRVHAAVSSVVSSLVSEDHRFTAPGIRFQRLFQIFVTHEATAPLSRRTGDLEPAMLRSVVSTLRNECVTHIYTDGLRGRYCFLARTRDPCVSLLGQVEKKKCGRSTRVWKKKNVRLDGVG